jgi:hypothetical protein
MWPALLVLGPSTPSTNKYAFTAIVLLNFHWWCYLMPLETDLGLFGRSRQLGDQPQRYCEFFELEVRAQERNCAIHTGLARYFSYIYASFA